MKADQMQARARHQCCQPLHEFQRRHHEVARAVAIRRLQLEHHLPGAVHTEPLVGDGQARDVAAQVLKRLALIGGAAHSRMQAETVGVPTLSEAPTFAEGGVNGVVVLNWHSIIAPQRTPSALVERLSKQIASALHSPELGKRLRADSSEAVGGSPTEFAAHVRAETKRWGRVNKQAGIRGE